jgi:glycosyltransferase involved in cell wall biosynthesis
VLRVLFLAGELSPWKVGGIATVVKDLANTLAAQPDLEIALLGTVPTDASLPRELYNPVVKDYTVSESRSPQPFRRACLQLGYLRQFRQWIRDSGTGRVVVHAHLLPGFRILPVVLEAHRLGCVLVQTIYDWPPLEIPYYRRHRFLFRLHWWLAQTQVPRAHAITVNSQFIKQQVSARWPGRSIRVVPNAVHVEEYSDAAPQRTNSSRCTFFFWGELYAKKGPRVLIEAAALVRALDPLLDFQVWLGGSGADSRNLQQEIHRRGLTNLVTLLGALSPVDLRARLRDCDVVVLPSAYEGFGLTILEAMAAARPVITTDRGGAVDIIRSAAEGLLVPRNPTAFARAMISLARGRDRRVSMGRAAHYRAKEFSWEAIGSMLVDVYQEAARLALRD